MGPFSWLVFLGLSIFYYKVRKKQKVFEVFSPFLLFISKVHDMRLKNLNLFFDENISFCFLRNFKVFSICYFWVFFKISNFFKKQINYMYFLKLNIKLYTIRKIIKWSFRKKYISTTFSPWVELRSRSNAYFEK